MTSDANLAAYNAHRVRNKQPPLAPTTRFKRQRGLNMSDQGWEGLRDLAGRLGYAGTNGANITALLEAIGYGLWDLAPHDSMPIRSATEET